MKSVTNEEVYNILKKYYKYNRSLFNKYNTGVIDRKELSRNIRCMNLAHMDLRGIDLVNITDSIKNEIFDKFMYDIDLSYFSNGIDGCNFEGSNLSGGNYEAIGQFAYCNFTNADLRNSNFRNCDFPFSDMKNALVDGCDFTDANLFRTENPPDLPMACPKEGEFIGYKSGYINMYNGYSSTVRCLPVLIKLLIPASAKRCSSTGLECRASEAIVLEFMPYNINDRRDRTYPNHNISSVKSFHDAGFIYRIETTVKPTEPFDDNRYRECSSGIHFFMDKNDAMNYGIDRCREIPVTPASAARNNWGWLY